MEPEGVVDVLRELMEVLVPGGVVVDLLSVPPPERVEAGGEILGELDGSRFFPRALEAAAGLGGPVAGGGPGGRVGARVGGGAAAMARPATPPSPAAPGGGGSARGAQPPRVSGSGGQ